MSDILPNEFAVTLTVNGREYHVKWFDEDHDAEGGCWQAAETPHGGAWRTLDELVEFIYRKP